jgi:hypothetical protein
MRARTLSDILREVNVAPQMQDTLARIVKNLGGGRMPTVFTTVANNISNAAESVVSITPALNPGSDAALVLVIGMWPTAAIGATGTVAITRIRQGTTVAGAQVGTSYSNTVVAANLYSGFAMAMDTPGAVAGMQYSMTAQITGGSANTNVVSAFLMAMAIG